MKSYLLIIIPHVYGRKSLRLYGEDILKTVLSGNDSFGEHNLSVILQEYDCEDYADNTENLIKEILSIAGTSKDVMFFNLCEEEYKKYKSSH